MNKEEVYNRIVQELIVAPDKLEKFLDAFGTMGIWFVFQHVAENNKSIEKLEKKVASQRRQLEDLELSVKKLQTSQKSLRRQVDGNKKPLID